jgi:hypothetical protein
MNVRLGITHALWMQAVTIFLVVMSANVYWASLEMDTTVQTLMNVRLGITHALWMQAVTIFLVVMSANVYRASLEMDTNVQNLLVPLHCPW